MKIDIEGADIVCLEALRQFENKPCHVSLESEKVSWDRLVQEIDLLAVLGYESFTAVQQADIQKTRLPLPALEGKTVTHRFPRGSSGMFGRDLQADWKSRDGILEDYESVFESYRRFGDATIWHTNILAKIVIRLLAFVLGRPIPGWYDTHARHPSCD